MVMAANEFSLVFDDGELDEVHVDFKTGTNNFAETSQYDCYFSGNSESRVYDLTIQGLDHRLDPPFIPGIMPLGALLGLALPRRRGCGVKRN